jgi:two-component system response regulator MprA
MATRILLVDDDPKIVGLLMRGLAYEGFEVTTANNGAAGLVAARTQRPHLVLLDIGLPGGPDGFELCRQLRREQFDTAVIMLTARDDVLDKVSALNLGADDYVAKPFSFDELVARMRAVLRRHRSEGEPLVYADLLLNSATHEVARAGQPITLTAREYELLLLFMRHPRQVLTRAQILDQVWGYQTEVDTNVVDVFIGHLRQKLEAQSGSRLIHTIRGIGYMLNALNALSALNA